MPIAELLRLRIDNAGLFHTALGTHPLYSHTHSRHSIHAECQLSHIDILRTVKMTTALSSPFPEGGEGHKMTSVPAPVQFVPNLIATPVLTQLGPSTKNYRYLTPIPVYYALT